MFSDVNLQSIQRNIGKELVETQMPDISTYPTPILEREDAMPPSLAEVQPSKLYLNTEPVVVL